MKKIFACLLCLLLLAACATGSGSSSRYTSNGHLVKQYGGPKTKPDPVETRAIVLVYPPTHERLNLTYYAHGDYKPEAMAAIDKLFRDRHTNEVYKIDPELIDFLVDIRRRLGLPPSVVFEILSGYRSPATNEKLRFTNGQVAKESLHMRGWAVDFRIPNVNGKAIAEIAKTMQRGGVSYYPTDNHVHVDLGNIRTWTTQ